MSFVRHLCVITLLYGRLLLSTDVVFPLQGVHAEYLHICLTNRTFAMNSMIHVSILYHFITLPNGADAKLLKSSRINQLLMGPTVADLHNQIFERVPLSAQFCSLSCSFQDNLTELLVPLPREILHVKFVRLSRTFYVSMTTFRISNEKYHKWSGKKHF